jgi:hypothetical protein
LQPTAAKTRTMSAAARDRVKYFTCCPPQRIAGQGGYGVHFFYDILRYAQ